MASPTDFVNLLLSQEGDQYMFGVEASPSDSDPTAFDCSELVEWGCARLGVTPRMPDGSWYQARHCRDNGTLIDVDSARNIVGALLFRFSSSPFTGGRPRSAHVAVSQGNGQTIEARSRRLGVGQFSALGRGWTHAGLIPGLHQPAQQEDDMKDYLEAVQRSLNAAGFRDSRGRPLVIDGELGPNTEYAMARRDAAAASGAPLHAELLIESGRLKVREVE